MSEKRTSGAAMRLQRNVLIELDYAVLHALKPQAEACRAVLTKSGLTLDDPLFMRFFFGKTLAQGVDSMAGKEGKTVDVPAVAAEIGEACRIATMGAMPDAKSVCASFVKDVLARELRVFFVTGMPESDVQQALGDLCGGQATVVSEPYSVCGCYAWDNWRRVVRKLQIRERLSVAVVGSGLSGKGALSTGMHVIARPDPLAESQDYSGTDMLTQKLDAAVRNEVLRVLRL